MAKIQETKKFFDMMGYNEDSIDFKEKLALVRKIVDARFDESEIDTDKVEDLARRVTLKENADLLKKLKTLEEYFLKSHVKDLPSDNLDTRIERSKELGNMLEIEGEIYDMVKAE